jgi:hypothetical protein
MNTQKLIETLATATSVELSYDEQSRRHVVAVRFDNREAAIAAYLGVGDLAADPDQAEEAWATARGLDR